MTDLDRVIAACEIAQRGARRRKAQAVTADDEPVVLAGLAAASRLLARLLREDEEKGYQDHTGTLG